MISKCATPRPLFVLLVHLLMLLIVERSESSVIHSTITSTMKQQTVSGLFNNHQHHPSHIDNMSINGQKITTSSDTAAASASNTSDSLTSEDIEFYNYLSHLYTSIQHWRDMYIVLGTCITLVGITLNALCILVFSKSKLFRRSTFPLYVYIIAIVDSLNILFRFVVPYALESYVRSRLVNDYHILNYNQEDYDLYTNLITSDYHCSLFFYFYNSVTLASVWLMAAVSLERWLVIKFTIQSRRAVRNRALCVLTSIFGGVLVLNLFDLTPGLYIKPQWYSNLTLLCERQDMFSGSAAVAAAPATPTATVLNNNNATASATATATATAMASAVIKQLGPIAFNVNTFALVRTLIQSVLPFSFVLLFNSLIIHNFKKIKLNAFSAAQFRNKINSFASILSGPHDRKEDPSADMGARHVAKHTKSKSLTPLDLVSTASNSDDARRPIYRRSLDLTPTATMATSCSPPPKAAPATPVENMSPLVEQKSNAHNKRKSSAFLVPPPPLAHLSRMESAGGGGATHSFNGTTTATSSGAQLSLLAHSDQAASTTPAAAAAAAAAATSSTSATVATSAKNNKQQRRSVSATCGFSPNELHRDASDLQISESMSSCNGQQHTQAGNGGGGGGGGGARGRHSSGLVKSSSTKGRRRLRMNRETDIMLIILSFCILLSQLPFTIAWHLIYHYDILRYIESIYISAATPKVLYMIRLLEMVYFSLNFVFYITLSPSLRREIKTYWRKRTEICHTLTKTKVAASFSNDAHGAADYIDYLDRLRSISPFRRRALTTTTSSFFFDTRPLEDFYLAKVSCNEKEKATAALNANRSNDPKPNNADVQPNVQRKQRSSTSTSERVGSLVSTPRIKIVIDQHLSENECGESGGRTCNRTGDTEDASLLVGNTASTSNNSSTN